MSIKVMSSIWDDHSGLLTGIEKAILLRLADFGSDSGVDIWPGKSKLSKDTGFSPETIKRVLRSLSNKKIISIKHRKKDVTNDINDTNLYTINVDLFDKNKPGDPKPIVGVGSVRPRVTVGSIRPPGGVCETLQGGVCETPDPLLYNHHITVPKTKITCSDPLSKDQPESYKDKLSKKEIDELFERFWVEYPNKKGKQKAKEKFLKSFDGLSVQQAEKQLVEMFYGLCRHVTEESIYSNIRKNNPTWNVFYPAWPHGSTWINQSRWKDTYNINEEEILNELKQQNSRKTNIYQKDWFING